MTSEEIDQYIRREYSIDCPRMVLRQNTENSPAVYEGPGTIYQTTEGGLAFKLYANGKEDFRAALARFFGTGAPQAGQIIPRDEYYSLEATSMSGKTWRGERILPDVSQGVSLDRIVTGSLYELVTKIDDPLAQDQKPYVSLNFAEDFDFPGNTPRTTKTFLKGVETSFSGDWTSAVFDAAELKFELHKHRGTVFLSAQSQGTALPSHIDSRICEAIEFVFFVPSRWLVREVREHGRYTASLRPFPKTKSKQSGRPPIKFVSAPVETSVWRLFAKYLEYILPHPDARWHPLSEDVHVVVTGDAGSLDVGLLALSIAVEGVLNIGFPKLAMPDNPLREQIELAEKLVSGSVLDESFKSRLAGLLGAMHRPRAKDKLRRLVEDGYVRKELVDGWASIRNSTVHASDIDPAEISKLYSRYQSALTLFNEIVILTIGYMGDYTDYSVPGWPRRNFERTFEPTPVSKES